MRQDLRTAHEKPSVWTIFGGRGAPPKIVQLRKSCESCDASCSIYKGLPQVAHNALEEEFWDQSKGIDVNPKDPEVFMECQGVFENPFNA